MFLDRASVRSAFFVSGCACVVLLLHRVATRVVFVASEELVFLLA
jgi:hypothetical protein